MERLTEWNREHTHGQLIKDDGITRLCEYKETCKACREELRPKSKLIPK